MNRIEYNSNNSGGDWWLTDQNWKDLAAAGWDVDWVADETNDLIRSSAKDGRWLGALATSASRKGVSLRMAIEEFERVTGQNSSALGCSCCGVPHNFTEYDENDKWIDSYSASFPEYGERY